MIWLQKNGLVLVLAMVMLAIGFGFGYNLGHREVDLVKERTGEEENMQSALCTNEPLPTEIGGWDWPTDIKYLHLRHLGAVFTADDCGPTRLQEIMDGSSQYGGGISLTTVENPSQGLLGLMQVLGFEPAVGTRVTVDWQLRQEEVPLADILKLKLYSAEIVGADCIYCG